MQFGCRHLHRLSNSLMERHESVIHRLGLPPEFGLVLLVLSLALAVAPYLANSDFGILKVPSFVPRTRKRLRVVGLVALLVAMGLHVPILRSQPQAAPASAPPSSSVVPNNPQPGRETFLAGTVVDERTEAAISNATVTAGDRWTSTDSTGTFRLPIPASDRVRIAVTAPGFAATAVEVVPPQASLIIVLREEEK